MKKILTFVIALIVSAGWVQMHAEGSMFDNITISSYVPYGDDVHGDVLSPKEAETLSTMLDRLMSTYGCAGAGFDNRFVIYPKVLTTRYEVAGLDSKHVVELDLNLFIGDAVDGTIFASTGCTLKGVGSTRNTARMAALRKTPTRNKEMKEFVELGKQRINDYYEIQGPAIINTAQSLAKQYKYDEAIAVLYVIPSTCKHYVTAQKLIGDYAQQYYKAQNDKAITEAIGRWKANPTEKGASEACDALAGVIYPTAGQQDQIKDLFAQFDQKFDSRELRNHELAILAITNAHEEEMGRIASDEKAAKAQYDAVAKLAKAFYSANPYNYNVTW